MSPNGKYEYDALYRLLKATGRELIGLNAPGNTDISISPLPNDTTAMRLYTQSYEYDEMGNIMKMIHLASSGNWTKHYHYASNNYLLSRSNDGTQGSDEYTYDAHGNMTSMPHLSSMSWDFADRLQSADLGGGGDVYYTYDAGGNRVRKVIVKNGGEIDERIYLGDWEVYREKNSGGTIQLERETLHISDDSARIARVDSLTINSSTAVDPVTPIIVYQLSNHLGTATIELDTSAVVLTYEEYHPFGSTSYRSEKSGANISLKRYRYVGKERDEETGLYYYGARYYAAWLARFISVDPLKDDYPYYTSYQYAGNKPIISIDIDGLESDANIGQQQKFKRIDTEKDEGGNILSKTTSEGTVTLGEGGSFKIHLLISYQDYTSGPIQPVVSEFIMEGVLENESFSPFQNTAPGLDRYVPEQQQIEARKWQIEHPLQPNQSYIGPGEGFVSDEVKQARGDLYESKQPVAGSWIPVYGPYAQGLKDLRYGHRTEAYMNLGKFLLDVALFAAPQLISARVGSAGGQIANLGKSVSQVQKAATGGRLGNVATREQISSISTQLEGRGYTITGGGQRNLAEEFLRPLGGGTRGGSYLDITAIHPTYGKLRINTVDVLKNGITPSARELRNANRIRQQINSGEHLLLIPKR